VSPHTKNLKAAELIMTLRGPRTRPIDQHFATEIRFRRVCQEAVAAGIGVSYQQIHSYETARSRLTAGRLHEIAQFYGVRPAEFFPRFNAAMTPKASETALEIARAAAAMTPPQQQSLLRIARAMQAPTLTLVPAGAAE